jgi:protein-tyrosine phosphatase
MRKVIYILPAFLFLIFANSCVSMVKISSVVERNTDGDLLLKWEVSPDQEGNIDIYVSETDTSLDNFSPVASARVADQVLRIHPSAGGSRQFFFLRTPAAFSGIVTNRIIDTQGIKNFRDAGGYFTTDNRQMKWGMIFRSGDLSNATLSDQTKIRELGIRTIIDFRSTRTARNFPILLHPSIRIVSLPLAPMDMQRINNHLDNDNFNRSDAIRYMQEMYVEIVENHKIEFADMFDVLTNESSYPILLTDALGKDGVGLATFFILHAIGIPENVLLDDYMFNSQNFKDIIQSTIDGQNLSESMQEAVTAMLSVNRAYLNFAIEHIRQVYGSVDNYLEYELRVSSGKKALLRRYLLYPF